MWPRRRVWSLPEFTEGCGSPLSPTFPSRPVGLQYVGFSSALRVVLSCLWKGEWGFHLCLDRHGGP